MRDSPSHWVRGVSFTAATVIVADDDPGVRLVCRLNLELEGYRVLEASSAKEVLQRLEEVDGDVVLLLDSRLGADDGIALGGELRRERPDLPIALITGDTRADDPEARGLTSHIIGKPFALEHLIATVRTLTQSSS